MGLRGSRFSIFPRRPGTQNRAVRFQLLTSDSTLSTHFQSVSDTVENRTVGNQREWKGRGWAGALGRMGTHTTPANGNDENHPREPLLNLYDRTHPSAALAGAEPRQSSLRSNQVEINKDENEAQGRRVKDVCSLMHTPIVLRTLPLSLYFGLVHTNQFHVLGTLTAEPEVFQPLAACLRRQNELINLALAQVVEFSPTVRIGAVADHDIPCSPFSYAS